MRTILRVVIETANDYAPEAIRAAVDNVLFLCDDVPLDEAIATVTLEKVTQ